MAKKAKTAITPTRAEDYPGWYQAVVKAADLAEISPVRGCMVIKPWGYAIWEAMQRDLDRRFKETGHVNAYFPIFIPKSFLEKEAEHVDGFAKECAVVTHHRLEEGPDGGLVPAGPLEEPLVVRPTSETIIGAMFSKWTQSYRDLPILINQWANVVRWEMRTRLFLRTAEFLWQEGHTAHATAEEAREETMQMLDVYRDFAEEVLAVPVVQGEKTVGERFPGAVSTYTIEAMMQDRKALQSGTSHFLGQNFARAQDITYLSAEGSHEYAWTTSWGVSTRLVGALIMTHSDDDGLRLPPAVAPQQIVILPVLRKDADTDAILAHCQQLAKDLRKLRFRDEPIRVQVDTRDLRGGEKVWSWVKKGVPIRIEIGPRDLENDAVFLARRDEDQKSGMSRTDFLEQVTTMLQSIQDNLLAQARAYRDEATVELTSQEQFEAFFAEDQPGGFAWCHAADVDDYEPLLKRLKVTARCIPLADNEVTGPCIFTGTPDQKKIVFAKAY